MRRWIDGFLVWSSVDRLVTRQGFSPRMRCVGTIQAAPVGFKRSRRRYQSVHRAKIARGEAVNVVWTTV